MVEQTVIFVGGEGCSEKEISSYSHLENHVSGRISNCDEQMHKEWYN